ncbi:restriction endonuclease subunit S [Sporomusa sp. GT1]|uniref:restriction endonuclease subunit S n=1 Tax=Sporomusa sp. GT1 TaxID=1534747 RepID=UPI001662B8B8|nr:restriction endonuclease subunit S [Sporomusa sp. GT1]
MKPYAEYKDSRMKWIGEIPKEWSFKKIKHFTTKIGSGKTPRGGNEVYVDDGIMFLRSQNVHNTGLVLDDVVYLTDEMDAELSNTRLKMNDVLLNITGASIGRACIWDKDIPGNVNQHVCIIRVNGIVLSKYLHYMLMSNVGQTAIDLYQTGANREGLNFEQIANIQIPFTDIHNQQIIVKYLNQKSAAIDTIIADKQKLIDLLKEKRNAIISEAVTKGLDKTAKMKDSGVEWIGEIPEDWEIEKIKWLFELVKRPYYEEDRPVLSITQSGIKIKNIKDNDGQQAQTYIGYQRVDVNDFAMNGMDLLTGYMDCSQYDGVTSPDYRVFRFWQNNIQNHEYYKHLFQMYYKRKIFYKFGQGVSNLGRWRLQTETFLEFLVPNPPIDVQEKIASYIQEKSHYIDSLITDITEQIVKLKEYRQSIISEVVTGKAAV